MKKEDNPDSTSSVPPVSDDLFRILAEKSPNMIFINQNQKIIYINEKCVEVMGYSREEFYASDFNFLSIIEPGSRDLVMKNYQQHAEGKDIPPYEYGLVTKAGNKLNAIHTTSLIKHNGNTAILGIVTDITERKKAEKELQRSEEKYQSLIANIPSVTWISRMDGETTFISPNIQEIYGYTPEEIYEGGEDLWFGRIHPDDAEEVQRSYKELFEMGGHFDIEYRIKRKDNEWIWLHDRAVTTYESDDVQYAYGIFSDITNRKEVEESLERSQQILMSVLDSMDAVAYVTDMNTYVVLYINKYARDIFGDVEGHICWQTFQSNQTGPCTFCTNDRLLAPGGEQEGVIHWEFQNTVDGKWYDIRDRAIQWIDGRTVKLEIATDITDRKKNEQFLREFRDRMSAVLKSAPLVLWSVDLHGTFTMSEGKALESINLKPGEVVGKSVFEIYREYPDIIRDIRKALAGDEVKSSVEVSGVIFESLYFPLRNQTGDIIGAFGVAIDITEKKKLAAEMERSNKLESIGILAGGIAHDFNNLLTAIMNNIYLAKIGIDIKSRSYSNLDTAEKGLFRAGDLTRQLLTFAKGGAPVKNMTHVTELIKDSAEFALRGSNVKCTYLFPDNIWSVEVDEGQMSQVIHNLVMNADQAMPKGGLIRIGVENSLHSSGTVIPLKEGRYVKVTIEDQGVGISDQDLPKIFDPYFSTKEVGQGLGLAITYSIIMSHEGYISAESDQGKGTTFTIYLPASKKNASLKVTSESGITAGEGRILIMDDEDLVRQSLGEMLESMGYDVEFAKDGNEAVQLYSKARDSKQPFHCVMLDLTVPGAMGGKEAMEQLLAQDPEIKAVVSSGYADDPVMADFSKYGFKGVIAKPYKVSELSSVLDKAIRG